MLDILDVYKKMYEDLLAIPVIKGIKTEADKFADSMYSTVLECIIPLAGKGSRVAVSHNLGQHLAKKFDIYYHSKNHTKELVWQTSWGLSSRAIGMLALIHGDDKGIVLPPSIAPLQVVMVPLYGRMDEKEKVLEKIKAIADEMEKSGIRCKIDERVLQSVLKHAQWEAKGVPLRMELDYKGYCEGEVMIVRRDSSEKMQVKWEKLKGVVLGLLDQMQKAIFLKAKKQVADTIVSVINWEQCKYYLNQQKICMAPWYCETREKRIGAEMQIAREK